MAPRRTFWQMVVCGCAVILLASCNTVHVHSTPNHRHRRKVVAGPPAHAKAYGHRMRHCGHELVYDSSYGVYVVVGRSDCYYHEGHFYRFYRNRWEISVRANSDWRPVVIESVPPGLRGRAKAKAKVKVESYAKTNGKAKHHPQAKP